MRKSILLGLIILLGVSLLSFDLASDQELIIKREFDHDGVFFDSSNTQFAIRYDAWSPGGGMTQTQDGSYLVPLGSSLVKISSSGSIEWQFSYREHRANSLSSTLDGGCISAGDIISYYGKSTDISLIKLSVWGDVEWHKSYGSPVSSLRKDTAYSVRQTNDGGYIAAGYSLENGPWNSTSHILILKLTSSGEQEWYQEYTYLSFEGLNKAVAIQQTEDNGYIAAGFAGAIRHEERLDICLLKLSSIGELEWIRLYGGDRREGAYSIQQAGGGGYIVAGYENSYPGQMGALVLKLFPDGQIEWQKSFKRDVPSCANSICQTPDGGYAVAGSGFDWDEGTDIWYLKLSPEGNVEWMKTFDREKKGAAYSIQPVDEGGYIVYAGIEGQYWWTDHFIDVERPLVLKLDSNGEIDASCALIQNTNVLAVNTELVPQDIYIGDGQPYYIGFDVEENSIEPESQTKEFTLLCGEANLNRHHPPLNFTGVNVFNRSNTHSQTENINVLTWETNPQNDQILAYRIYQLKTYQRILIAEVDGGLTQYWHRNVNIDDRKYHIVSVDVYNKESYPAMTIINKKIQSRRRN